jgi:hypothetical protein
MASVRSFGDSTLLERVLVPAECGLQEIGRITIRWHCRPERDVRWKKILVKVKSFRLGLGWVSVGFHAAMRRIACRGGKSAIRRSGAEFRCNDDRPSSTLADERSAHFQLLTRVVKYDNYPLVPLTTRPISWIKPALRDFQDFPEGARTEIARALVIAAEGGRRTSPSR